MKQATTEFKKLTGLDFESLSPKVIESGLNALRIEGKYKLANNLASLAALADLTTCHRCGEVQSHWNHDAVNNDNYHALDLSPTDDTPATTGGVQVLNCINCGDPLDEDQYCSSEACNAEQDQADAVRMSGDPTTGVHTATPWVMQSYASKTFLIDHCGKTEPKRIAMLGQNHEANAAFIVKAVNSHDQLVAALRELRPRVAFCDVPIIDAVLNAIEGE